MGAPLFHKLVFHSLFGNKPSVKVWGGGAVPLVCWPNIFCRKIPFLLNIFWFLSVNFWGKSCPWRSGGYTGCTTPLTEFVIFPWLGFLRPCVTRARTFLWRIPWSRDMYNMFCRIQTFVSSYQNRGRLLHWPNYKGSETELDKVFTSCYLGRMGPLSEEETYLTI